MQAHDLQHHAASVKKGAHLFGKLSDQIVQKRTSLQEDGLSTLIDLFDNMKFPVAKRDYGGSKALRLCPPRTLL